MLILACASVFLHRKDRHGWANRSRFCLHAHVYMHTETHTQYVHTECYIVVIQMAFLQPSCALYMFASACACA